MAYDQRPGAAALYRLDRDCSVRPVLDNVTVSNGLEWSPDGSLVYYKLQRHCRKPGRRLRL
jgi:sugar lactone lactonase YvrE